MTYVRFLVLFRLFMSSVVLMCLFSLVQISFLHLLTFQNNQSHLFVEGMVIQVTLIAIAVTLAAYCCKVANCCAPAPKMVNQY